MWGRGGKSLSLQLFMGQRGKTDVQELADGAPICGARNRIGPPRTADRPLSADGDEATETTDTIATYHRTTIAPASPRRYAKIPTSALFNYPTGFA